MHILYIHQYFATPLGATGTRSYEFARRWVASGHKVTMLTSTAVLAKEDLVHARGWFFKRFTVEGINVLAMTVPYRQQMGVFKRCLSFLAFQFLATFITIFTPRVDIIYATSPPLTIGIPALAWKWFRHKKFVFEVRDQWPEAVVEVGAIKNIFVIKLLFGLEKLIYKNASALIAVSNGMAEGVREVAGQNKTVHVVPNSSDLNLFSPDIDGREIRRDRNWNNKLVLIHAGAMGKVNRLDFVINAALKLKEHHDILFVLLGRGSQKDALENSIRDFGLTNVEIISAIPKTQLPVYLAAADVALVIGSLKIHEKQASANKFYDGLAAGKPMLLNYYGWQGKLLEERDAGFGCKLFDLDEFVEKVLYFNSHRAELAKMGASSRLLAEERFNRDELAQKALDAIIHAAS
jgi:glycosyltransferase involved in cell wall biosynthesis